MISVVAKAVVMLLTLVVGRGRTSSYSSPSEGWITFQVRSLDGCVKTVGTFLQESEGGTLAEREPVKRTVQEALPEFATNHHRLV